MSTHARIAFAIVIITLLSGCGTTRVVREGNDFAQAGKTYTVAMGALAGYMLEKQIDNRFDMLMGYRRSGNTDPEFYKARLADVTDDTIEFSTQIGLFREHTKLLGEYFDALNDLVNAKVTDTGAAAVKAAAGGLNAVGQALQTSLKVSTEQIDAISNLGGFAFTQVHGAEVKRVLEHDGPLIARQMALQQRALEVFTKSIERIDKMERSVMYDQDIEKVYIKDADKGATRPPLDTEFKKQWSLYVKEPALSPQLAAATETSKKMQKAWRDLLQGKEDVNDLLADSGNLLSAAEQAKALHENRRKPAAP